MSNYYLKWIAIISMIIDHMGAILFPDVMTFRYIGRIAFPIFCFLIVEGSIHTSNWKKYALRLGIFAIISEFAFDYAIHGTRLGQIEYSSQNIFFTLLIGLLVLKAAQSDKTNHLVMQYLYVFIGCVIAYLLNVDYSSTGIMLIFSMYLFRNNLIAQLMWLCILYALTFWNILIVIFASFSMIPIAVYNKEKGKDMKYLFYIIYPLHLFILGLISKLY